MVHHVEGAGFGQQQVEHVDIVQLATRDMDKAGDGATEIEKRMELDRSLGQAKGDLGEHGQTEIYHGGIQRIDRVGELHPEVVFGIQGPCTADEGLCEFCIDSPVARFVCIGQRRATDGRTQPHAIELAG